QIARRPLRARLRQLSPNAVANHLAIQAWASRIRGTGALTLHREQSGVGLRCRARRRRDYRGVLLSRGRIHEIARAGSATTGFSAAAPTNQLRLLAEPLYAGQAARLSRLRHTAPQGAPRRPSQGGGAAETRPVISWCAG